jgi:hypothetical protein
MPSSNGGNNDVDNGTNLIENVASSIIGETSIILEEQMNAATFELVQIQDKEAIIATDTVNPMMEERQNILTSQERISNQEERKEPSPVKEVVKRNVEHKRGKKLIIDSLQTEDKSSFCEVKSYEDLRNVYRDIEHMNYLKANNTSEQEINEAVSSKVVFHDVVFGTIPEEENSDKILRALVYIQRSKQNGNVYSLFWYDPLMPDKWIIESLYGEESFKNLIDNK